METQNSRINTQIIKKHQEYFDLAHSFLKCADDLQDKCVRMEITREHLGKEGFILFFLFAKSCKTTIAALNLCETGYPEDALILSRVNFEAALKVLYILKDKENAKEKAEAYFKYDVIYRVKKLKQLLNMYEHENEYKAKFQETFEELRRQLPSTDDERERICKLAGKNRFELAKENDLLHLLYRTFYWDASDYTHNSLRIADSYVTDADNGHVDFFIMETEKGIRNVIIHLCLFLWYLMDRCNFLFGLGAEKTLKEKWVELESIFKKTSPLC
ncbi:MAG: hypothetical protein AMJ89_05180 [candidate division Zixibacteria bacterium SM23_73]|nr:MAG: hypothetical protein AMJ89_05180 [candidate division Zixibacteria bacterium SM23_73]